MGFSSTKTFGNERGLSCAFRQWRANHSHCQYLHGYALGFKFTFDAHHLDERNWVQDFGGCDWIFDFLKERFDHTVAVATDDPELPLFSSMQSAGLIQLVTFEDVGCEKFAQAVYDYCAPRINAQSGGRVVLRSVEVFEHGSNSAIYGS